VQQRTAATLVTLILSLCVLVLLAVPLTWRRVVLVGAALAGFVLLFPIPAVRRFYELQLPRSGLATTLAVAALGAAALAGFWILSRRRGRGPPPGGPPVTATSEPRPEPSRSPPRPDIPEMRSRRRLVLFACCSFTAPGSGAAPRRGAPAGPPADAGAGGRGDADPRESMAALRARPAPRTRGRGHVLALGHVAKRMTLKARRPGSRWRTE
jgi:hypothetical protein